MSCQAHLEDLAAAAQALQDVLDVMRQGGDGLADGRQPLGLHHGLVVARLLDGQGRLVGDGDGQGQVVLGELAAGLRTISLGRCSRVSR